MIDDIFLDQTIVPERTHPNVNPGGGGLTQHFPKAKATAALSENQGPKVFDEFRRAAEKQAFLGRHPPKGYGGQR